MANNGISLKKRKRGQRKIRCLLRKWIIKEKGAFHDFAVAGHVLTIGQLKEIKLPSGYLPYQAFWIDKKWHIINFI